jgi:hypothetical protein
MCLVRAHTWFLCTITLFAFLFEFYKTCNYIIKKPRLQTCDVNIYDLTMLCLLLRNRKRYDWILKTLLQMNGRID